MLKTGYFCFRLSHCHHLTLATRLRSYHLDAVGVSDQLVDVERLAAQPRRVVLQDDAFAGAAVQAVGRLSFCCTYGREGGKKKKRQLVSPKTYFNLSSGQADMDAACAK